MGDNGYFLGDRGYADKWLMYEQSIRVPMIIYDPRQPASSRGKTHEEMVLNVDVTPTILKLAGMAIPERYAGKSLTEFYSGSPQNWRNSNFLRTPSGGESFVAQDRMLQGQYLEIHSL